MENTVLNKKYGSFTILFTMLWHILGYIALCETLLGCGTIFFKALLGFDDVEGLDFLWLLIGGILEFSLLLIPIVLIIITIVISIIYKAVQNTGKLVISILFMIFNSLLCIINTFVFLGIMVDHEKNIGAYYGDSAFRLVTALFFNPLVQLLLLVGSIVLLSLTFSRKKNLNPW